MSYKAFVSSTYKDLKDHRAHVIRALRNAGFDVDPMEDWTAAADEPNEFSRERLEGCHLCVLLVARRRGHVPSGETLSITQMELAEALCRQIDVLPFLLDDSVAEDQWPWEEKEIVRAWRADVLEHFGVGTFKKTPSSLKIGPALTRWITEQGPKVALRLYLESVKQHHGYIKFLGLPRLEDIQDAPIQRLFVEPAVAGRAVSPDIDPAEWPETTPVRETLAKHPRLVLLGDPGSGKSTLVDWLAWQLAEGYDGARRGSADNARRGSPDPAETANARRGSPDPAETTDRRSPGSVGKGDLRSQAVARSGDRPQRESAARQDSLVPLPMILRELRIGAGITWERLLQAFVDRPLGKLLTLANLERILKDGGAMIMLDGLDEIGDPQVRLDLRDAVWDGMATHEKCRWLLLSRIVGYDDVRFDLRPISNVAKFEGTFEEIWRDEHYATRNYVAPFDDSRVDEFAENWFVLREKTTHKAKQGAADLLKAIRGDEATKKLGRIPNLLMMMALIHRMKGVLPHGKALLYSDIAQAYLETIDQFRRIDVRSDSLAEKKRWVARVGFEMQRKRVDVSLRETKRHLAERDDYSGEIFAAGGKVRRWTAVAMSESLEQRSDEDAAEFVDYLGRRAGLLLPRGQDQFAFMHLSFQEYFAACFLQNQIASPDWLLDEESIPPGAGKEDLRNYARQTVWRETLVFLIELLAASDQPKWLRPARQALFGRDYADVRDGDASVRGQAALLARLAVDPHAGFGDQERWRAIEACCRWEAGQQSNVKDGLWLYDNDVLRELLSQPVRTQQHRTLNIFVNLANTLQLRTMDLSGTAVTDVTPLSGLENLHVLDLSGVSVSDLTPLSTLTDLRVLGLNGTSVTDLTALTGLANLKLLYLHGTPVSDLAPLAALANLQEIHLRGTSVSDLTPLGHLKSVGIYLDRSQKVKLPKHLARNVRWYSAIPPR